MLRGGANADQENQNADDAGLEPQDRIGFHGKAFQARHFFKIFP
jgi:hypothetical protein